MKNIRAKINQGGKKVLEKVGASSEFAEAAATLDLADSAERSEMMDALAMEAKKLAAIPLEKVQSAWADADWRQVEMQAAGHGVAAGVVAEVQEMGPTAARQLAKNPHALREGGFSALEFLIVMLILMGLFTAAVQGWQEYRSGIESGKVGDWLTQTTMPEGEKRILGECREINARNNSGSLAHGDVDYWKNNECRFRILNADKFKQGQGQGNTQEASSARSDRPLTERELRAQHEKKVRETCRYIQAKRDRGKVPLAPSQRQFFVHNGCEDKI